MNPHFRSRYFFASTVAAGLLACALNESAVAQTERISVFADAAGSACSIIDQPGSTLTVYVIQEFANCTVSVDMSVIEGGGFSATYLNETHLSFVHIGDFRNGVSVGYGEGKSGTVLIGSIEYAGHGTSAPCPAYSIDPIRTVPLFPSP